MIEYIACFLGGAVTAVFVLFVVAWESRRRDRMASGLCQWCGEYIAQEDRESKYQTNGGHVMCPHCWTETKVNECVWTEELEILS